MYTNIIINEDGDKSKIGYVRVSSQEQAEHRQTEALKGLNLYKIYVEKISAKDTNRPMLQEALNYLRNGDTLYIKDFSRLARSTKDLLELVELLQKKGVTLISLKENIDTSTPTGKLMLTMIGAINAFERENLLERQSEAIHLCKIRDKENIEKYGYEYCREHNLLTYKGRSPVTKPQSYESVMQRVLYCQLSNNAAMELLGLSRSTYYSMKQEYLKELRDKQEYA